MASDIDELIEIVSEDDENADPKSPVTPDAAPSKRRRISSGRFGGEAANIWLFFEYLPAKDASLCKKCGKLVPKRDISNNVKHLKNNHPTLYQEYEELQARKGEISSSLTSPTTTPRTGRQLTLFEACDRSIRYAKSDPRQQEITSSLARLFAAHSLPLRMADSPLYRQLLFTLDKRNTPTGRNCMRRAVIEESEKLKKRMDTALSTVRKLSVCVNLWSKKSLTASFVGVTAHFVYGSNYRLVRLLLAVAEIKGAHTAENISTIVNEVLDQWNIDMEKVRCFVTDNGANVVKAFREINETIEVQLNDTSIPTATAADSNLEEESPEDKDEDEDYELLERDQYVCYGRQKRLPCFAHMMVNALKCTIESSPAYEQILNKAMAVVRSFSTSTTRIRLLLEREGKKLISPVRTRWLFAYYMLERLVSLKDSVKAISDQEDVEVFLSRAQWEQIELLVEFLREFAIQVEYLEGERYTTINNVIPALLELGEHCEEFRDMDMFASMAVKVSDELKKRFAIVLDPTSAGYQPIFSVATLLDPSVRRFLRMSNQYDSAKTELLRMGRLIVTERVEAIVQDTSSEGVSINMTNKSVLFRRLFQRMENDRPILEAQSLQQMPVCDEIEKYLSEESDLDAMQYWRSKAKSKEFPILSEVAWDVFSVPATSAPIERVFSHAGIASSGRRSRINADLLNAELQMRLNYLVLNE